MATILVVDDRAENREFLVSLLGYGGHRLLQAVDGSEALDAARRECPDLVITDLLMPTMDGFELVRRLRDSPGLSDVRVIFYTATYLESDARGLAEACGVRHILTKPAEPEDVLRVVSEILDVPPVAPAPESLKDFESEHLRVLNMTLAHKAEVVVPRLNAIIELSMQLASELDPSRLLAMSCAGARKILGAKFCLVSLSRRARPEDDLLFSSGLDSATAARLPAQWEPVGPFVQLMADRRPFRLSDGQAWLPPGLPPARGILASAIQSPGTAYGFLCVSERLGGGEFSDEEEQLAAVMGGLVGRIYENGSLYAATRRHADQLRESERRFRSILENVKLLSLMLDRDARITYCNDYLLGLTGWRHEEIAGRSWFDVFVPPELGNLRAVFASLMKDEPQAWHHENEILTKSGARRLIRWNNSVLRGATGEVIGTASIGEDITEQRSLDQQLRQSQKMEAVGRLAGGVAHDFNNLLGVIMGYTEGTLRLLAPDHAGRPKLEEVLKASERAAGVTRQLLTFSRQRTAVARVIDLDSIVGEMHRMLRTLIGEDVELRTVPGSGLGRIKADTGEIEQVILNLAVNARDAMPRGGCLTIETSNEDVGAEFTRTHAGVEPGRYVRLVVSDNGTGIPKEIQANIFEPFFTTKDPGKGTGLGLATVYGIVKQWGGHIFVYSEVGHGTAFRIYFPRVDRPADPLQPAAPPTLQRGHETILVVEDEELLRTVTREMLEDCGYTVLEAANGASGLDLAATHEGPIHLLITDVIMPGLNGRETAARMSRLRPNAKVLYISGYTSEVILHHGVLPTDVELLPKPYTAGALARKVREILDAPRKD